MITQLLLTFLGWLVLWWLSINLVGMLVRSLFTDPELTKLATEGSEPIKKFAKQAQDAERKVNLTALVLVLIYLGCLFYFLNIWVVVAALMIMIARIPDLLWEIRNGKENVKQMPAIYHLTTLIMIGALPVLWYALHSV